MNRIIKFPTAMVTGDYAASSLVLDGGSVIDQCIATTAGDKGNMQSQVNVANAYYQGHGTELDHHKAFLWYREAAFQGHIISQKNLGAAYWNGDGVEKNQEECVFWYELAASGGDAQAQFATGWFLMTGMGVPKDERKGLKWIHKATFQGFQPAIDYCKEHGYKWY